MTRFIPNVRKAGFLVVLLLLGTLIVSEMDDMSSLTIEGPFVAISGDLLAAGVERLRLEDIDAPEIEQVCLNADATQWACGEVAREALEQLVSQRPVVCKASGRDQREQLLVRCDDGERSLNAEMVRIGMALSPDRFSQEEDMARKAGTGLWGGKFDNPNAWRKLHGLPDDPGYGEGLDRWMGAWFGRN